MTENTVKLLQGNGNAIRAGANGQLRLALVASHASNPMPDF